MTNDPTWKLKEKIVAIIERHLEHDAIVERDKQLPVLTSKSDRTRQCDVVITEGNKPRQTISIIEVQNRSSKPSINDFEGWITKMRQVGAQHLICVSEKGFPSSIEERADELGPTIRLLTLKQLEEHSTPFPTGFYSQDLQVVRYDQLVGLQMEYQHLVRMDPSGNNELPNPHDKVFRVEGNKEVSVTDIMDWHLFKTPKNLEELPVNQVVPLIVNFHDQYDGFFEHKTFDGKWVKLKSLKINFRLFIKTVKLSWELEKYDQVGWGEIGWVAKATTNIDGKPFHIITPIKRIGHGEYSFGRPVTMSDSDAFISLGDKVYKAERYND